MASIVSTTWSATATTTKPGSSASRAATWAQFGISADPRVATAWRHRTIPDDPRVVSNTRGTVAFAFKDPNGRTAQVFINLKDNASTHDGEPFVPFARVVEGMEAADAFYSEYGEKAGGGIRGGKQDPVFDGGQCVLPPRVSQARLHQAGDDRSLAAGRRAGTTATTLTSVAPPSASRPWLPRRPAGSWRRRRCRL